MANSRMQRKANRSNLRATIWENWVKCMNKYDNDLSGAWKYFTQTYFDIIEFRNNPMYRQEYLIFKSDLVGIIKGVYRNEKVSC